MFEIVLYYIIAKITQGTGLVPMYHQDIPAYEEKVTLRKAAIHCVGRFLRALRQLRLLPCGRWLRGDLQTRGA